VRCLVFGHHVPSGRIAIRCEIMGNPSSWWEKAPKIVIKFISNMNTQAALVHKVMQNIRIEMIEFMLSKHHFVLLYKSSRHGLQPTNSGHVLNACHCGVSYPNSSLQITKPFLSQRDRLFLFRSSWIGPDEIRYPYSWTLRGPCAQNRVRYLTIF
jgi:hypothetical protein